MWDCLDVDTICSHFISKVSRSLSVGTGSGDVSWWCFKSAARNDSITEFSCYSRLDQKCSDSLCCRLLIYLFEVSVNVGLLVVYHRVSWFSSCFSFVQFSAAECRGVSVRAFNRHQLYLNNTHDVQDNATSMHHTKPQASSNMTINRICQVKQTISPILHISSNISMYLLTKYTGNGVHIEQSAI